MRGDTDDSAYTVAFGDGGFLMVFNPRRGGWEMPGGHIREGETAEEGARREFMEEAGYLMDIVQSRPGNGCTVFAAEVVGPHRPCEMEVRFFTDLPAGLSFGRGEYEGVIEWARDQVLRRGRPRPYTVKYGMGDGAHSLAAQDFKVDHMAKMHSRRKGRASSERPMISENPSWVPLSAAEIESKVAELAKDGMSAAMIGMVLRDQYAVPNVKLATGKTVTEILAGNGFKNDLPEDIARLMARAINLNVHIKANPNDTANKRGLDLIEAKIRRLERYYKRNGVLPATWKYSLANAELMLK